MKNIIKAVISISTIALLFVTLFDLNSQVRAYKSMQSQWVQKEDSLIRLSDSLQSEVFRAQVEEGRLGITVNQILSKYPKVYAEFNQYLETQTE